MENTLGRQQMKNKDKVDKKSPMKPSLEANKAILQEPSFSPFCSSSKLRTRKEVPAFRKVDLDENDCDRIVGKRVKVYWSGSRKWFTGRIRGFDSEKGLHFIFYDDGDKEEVDLKKEPFEIEVMPAEGFKLRAKSSLKMKSRDSNGEKSISGLVKKETNTTSCSEPEENSCNSKEKENNGMDCLSDVPIAEFKTQGFWKKRRRHAARQTVQEDLSSPRRSSYKLRPKTEVPSFMKVNLEESDCERIVGKRIKVYWSGSRKWFTGRISGFDTNKRLHSILYDDGDKEEVDLRNENEKFKLEIRLTEGFKLQPAAGLSEMTSMDGNKSILGKSKEESDSDAAEISQDIIKDYSSDTTLADYIKTHVSSKRHVPRDMDTVKDYSTDTTLADYMKTHVSSKRRVRREMDTVDYSTDTTLADYMKAHVSSKRRVRRDMNTVQADLVTPCKSSTKLRPRKAVPVFQMIDLEDSDFERIVGKRVKVFWPLSRKWFTGRIKSFDAKKRLHFVLYDDGDKEDLDLRNEKFKLEILPVEGFELRFETFSRRKSRSRDSGKRSSSMMGEPDGTEKEMNKKDRDDKKLVQAAQPSNLSKLRPRKEVSSFCKVNLDENDNERIVGKRVKVYWSGSRRWFIGRIRGFDSKKTLHSILYDDGDKEELDLRNELFKLEILHTDGFKLRTKPNRRIKSSGTNSGKRSFDVINENSVTEKEMRSYDPKKEKEVTIDISSGEETESESEYTREYFSTDEPVSKSTKIRIGKRRSFNFQSDGDESSEDVVVFPQVNKNISMGDCIMKDDVGDVSGCSKAAHSKKDEEEMVSGQINVDMERSNSGTNLEGCQDDLKRKLNMVNTECEKALKECKRQRWT